MVDNPNRWRATITQLENRNATAGCLLSLLFAVPYMVKNEVVNLPSMSVLVVIYVVVVVPLLTGILSTRTFFQYLRFTTRNVFNLEFWRDVGFFILFVGDWCHFLYLQMSTVHSTVMQVAFGLAAENLICPEQRLCCLHVLLFYCVIAYLERTLQTRPLENFWSERSTTTGPAEVMKLATVLLIVRLGKAAVTSMVLFTVTVQFQHIEPPVDFVVLTLIYFCLTQYRGSRYLVRTLVKGLARLDLHWLEGMEELVVPFALDIISLALGCLITAASIISSSSYALIVILSYTNVAVPYIQIRETSWHQLSKEWRKIKRFPFALWNNPQVRPSSCGLCAICLDKLQLLSSRVTPCGHVFHGVCLRRSLHYTSWCPLCKSPL